MSTSLFPTDLPGSQWVRFRAEGFSRPVCGVIYRLAQPATNGMPLGSVDTGCLDLETSGLLGYSTIFNTHVPRMGPLNLPFLGVNVGGATWVLCDPTQMKPYSILQTFGTPFPAPPDFPQCGGTLSLEGVKTVKEIHYWGHYPVADIEYEIDAPIDVGLRAWTSFLPGHIEDSLIPGAVFELRLRNTSRSHQEGNVAFSFPGPTEGEAGEGRIIRQKVHGSFHGIHIKGPKASYAIGVISSEGLRIGGELGGVGTAWARIDEELPDMIHARIDQKNGTIEGQLGASAAVGFDLQPREQKSVSFVLAWHSPQWKGGGYPSSEVGHTYTHMYAKHYQTAVHAASMLSEKHENLLKRILAWQQAIYTDPQMPPWLQEVLINNFHLITEVGMWAQAKPPIGDWCQPEDGLWGLNECPRGCPQIECGGNTYYGGMAEQYFFPRLVKSTLRASKAYQYPDGCPTWIFGGVTCSTPPIDMVEPARGYQIGQNGSWYVGMVARHWMRTRDDDFLREFYPSLKKATLFTFNLNPQSPYGLISLPNFDLQESYESIPFKGMSSHVGSIRLYHLKIMEKMARRVGDEEFAEQCRRWFQQASQLMEEHLWAGSYYVQAKDPATGKVEDVVMGYQLDGEFMACHDGVPEGVFPVERLQTALETLQKVADDNWGTRTWSDPKGGPVKPNEFNPGYWSPNGVHAPGALMLAMTYMYKGEKEYGLNLARRILENMVCRQRWTWDMPILYRADTGEGIWGNDYGQMMICWALPAAVEGKDVKKFSESCGLIDRIILAARGQEHP